MNHNESSTNKSKPVANSKNLFTISPQPWWHGIEHDNISRDILGDKNTNTSEQREPKNGGMGTETSKSHVKTRIDVGTDVTKEMLVTVASQADGKFGEQQLPQHAASVMLPAFGEYLTPPTQLEFVGHSIACASNPYSEYYGGAGPAYGHQALVHPQNIGMHSARMVLPLEMAEEPVYVNAKQYHGILRRRQLRAKAELERKLIKVRKPYLHESRHLHAMRRARGCGGRFVNTKKLDNQASNAAPTNGTSLSVSTQPPNSSSFESAPTNYSRSSGSSTGHREVTKPQVHDVQQKQQQQQRCYNGNGQPYPEGSGNGNGCYPPHQGFQLFKYQSVSDNKAEGGDYPGQQQRERIVANRAQHRALTIK